MKISKKKEVKKKKDLLTKIIKTWSATPKMYVLAIGISLIGRDPKTAYPSKFWQINERIKRVTAGTEYKRIS